MFQIRALSSAQPIDHVARKYRAEKAPGASKGHWEFRSFTKGPNIAFGDTKDPERLREKKSIGKLFLSRMIILCRNSISFRLDQQGRNEIINKPP
eukprot:sb/3479280/